MPTIRQNEDEDIEANNVYMNVSLECLDKSADVSRPTSRAVSIEHVVDTNYDAQLRQVSNGMLFNRNRFFPDLFVHTLSVRNSNFVSDYFSAQKWSENGFDCKY